MFKYLAVIAMFVSVFAQGEVFKCKNAEGKTEYKDHPCTGTYRTQRVYADDTVSRQEYEEARNVHLKTKTLANNMEARNRPATPVAASTTSGGGSTYQQEVDAARQRRSTCMDSMLNERTMGYNAAKNLQEACRSGAKDPIGTAREATAIQKAEREARRARICTGPIIPGGIITCN